jgi:8-amino-7-oxononanoate synthase
VDVVVESLELAERRGLTDGAFLVRSGREFVVIDWDFLESKLEGLRNGGLYREPEDGAIRESCLRRATALGVTPIDASSNDYLGYAKYPVSRETYLESTSTGAGASRLIHGTRPEHQALERALSTWVGQPATLLFASGYAANMGVMGTMAQLGDLVISDSLNHASIIDGCRLSRAEVAVYAHTDIGAVDSILRREAPKRRCWVVTETYFSMDGDSPDLQALRSICDERRAALVVDEAHALGVFGPNGSGLCNQYGFKPDVLVGTFGKALGAQGAFVASSTTFRNWLWNRARSFVYSTALSPLLAEVALRNLTRARADDSGRSRLSNACAELRDRLAAAGIELLRSSYGPIVPIILGSPERALAVTDDLISQGILVQAIRPPTVAPDSCRIRVTVNSTFNDEQVQRLAASIIRTCSE